jgi:ARG and Rhodanese-Phosphatase-superfamily-associated Protein domain
MNKSPLNISGPYTHENLAIFLFHDPDHLDGAHYIPLGEAMEKKYVFVYETGSVGELEAENLSETFDVFIQAGDVLKGGRQDRTIAIDFIIPARSGRVPIPAFCVESGRWHRRNAESQRYFSCSTHTLHAKRSRLAAKLKRSQSEVWEGVAACQEELRASLGEPVHAADSPTSYQLSLENPELQRCKGEFRMRLGDLANAPGILGYAFYVSGQRNSADIYTSTSLFHKLWDKLLDVAILEAISSKTQTTTAPSKENVEAWLEEAAGADLKDRRDAPPRTRLATRSRNEIVIFETFDTRADEEALLHTNIIAQ